MNTQKLKYSVVMLVLISMLGLSFISNDKGANDNANDHREKVRAIVTEKRQQMESMLSKKEKLKLSELRAELQSFRNKNKEKVQSYRDSRQNGEKIQRELTEEEIQERIEMKWRRQEILNEAFAIAENHKSELQSLFVEMRMEINEEMENFEPQKRSGNRRGFKHDRHRGFHAHTSDPSHFLLMDPSGQMNDK